MSLEPRILSVPPRGGVAARVPLLAEPEPESVAASAAIIPSSTTADRTRNRRTAPAARGSNGLMVISLLLSVVPAIARGLLQRQDAEALRRQRRFSVPRRPLVKAPLLPVRGQAR